MIRLALILMAAWGLAGNARAQGRLDDAPRVAVISAFGPEMTALKEATSDKRDYVQAGVTFTTGILEGKPVVLFLSGMSMVNAAMTTQAALDRFKVTRVVFSGIAGGVDPALDVGDVVVAEQWGQYLENALAREVAPGKFEPPQGELLAAEKLAPFGMMYPRGVVVTRAPGQVERRVWFPADPAMLGTARDVAGKVRLKRCVAERCLAKEPRVVVGGNGVSGQSFVDNAAVRTWAYGVFGAKVLDMESAAVAQVAYVNGAPFIAFRSLSDLAGGDPGKNQALTFFQLASDNSAAVVRAFIAALP
jgi:adenosylhomocysteine nucleosidase